MTRLVSFVVWFMVCFKTRRYRSGLMSMSLLVVMKFLAFVFARPISIFPVSSLRIG